MKKMRKFLGNILLYGNKIKLCVIVIITVSCYHTTKCNDKSIFFENHNDFYISFLSSLVTILSILITIYGVFLSYLPKNIPENINKERYKNVVIFLKNDIEKTLYNLIILIILTILLMLLTALPSNIKDTLFLAFIMFFLLFTIVSFYKLIYRMAKFFNQMNYIK